MELKEAVEKFRKDLDETESQGATRIEIATLREYLDQMSQFADVSQQYQDREHANILAQSAARNQFSVEMLKAVLEAGKSALQALLVINGGAAVALLGVMSNLAGKGGVSRLATLLALPMLEFGLGVLLGAVGFAFRYLSQACYAEMADQKSSVTKWGDRLRYAAVATALAGYVLFGVAVVNAYNAVIWSFP